MFNTVKHGLGNQNALKHGRYARETRDMKKRMRELVRLYREVAGLNYPARKPWQCLMIKGVGKGVKLRGTKCTP